MDKMKFKKIIEQNPLSCYRPEYEAIVDGEVIGKVWRKNNATFWTHNGPFNCFHFYTRQEAAEHLLRETEKAAKAEVV